MDVKKEMTLVFDRELSEAWEKLLKRKRTSFSEFIKEVLTRENLKYSTYHISESVEAISGTLNTQLNYKTLRDTMIEERLKDYENIH